MSAAKSRSKSKQNTAKSRKKATKIPVVFVDEQPTKKPRKITIEEIATDTVAEEINAMPTKKDERVFDIKKSRKSTNNVKKNNKKSPTSKPAEVKIEVEAKPTQKTKDATAEKSKPKPARKLSKRQRILRQRKLLVRFLAKTGLLILLAVVLVWFLQYRHAKNDAGAATMFVAESPLVFLYTSLLMFLALVLLTGITRRPFVAAGIMTAGIIIISYININKMEARGAPLLPEDFQLAGNAGQLMQFIDLGELVRMIIAAVLAIGLGFLLNYATRDWLGVNKALLPRPKWRRWAVLQRVGLVALAGCSLVVLTDFARNHSKENSWIVSSLNTEWIGWNQKLNYNKNGFILGFLYNAGGKMKQNELEYNEEIVKLIAENYNEIKQTEEKKRKSLADQDYNIVVILNESFSDPEVVAEYYPYEGGEIVPNLREIQKKYPSGTMLSSAYGGGTSNVEFEVNTGFSNYWARTTVYTDILSKKETFPSIASFARSNNYQTMAIHPFDGTFYDRNKVLQAEGFEKFIDQDQMNYTETDALYINDKSLYNETLDILKNSDQKQMLALISMQNHGLWYDWMYDHYDFTAENQEDSEKKSSFEAYWQTLHNSDCYLGEFLEALDEMEEETVVLFYGDHAPGILDEVIENKNREERQLAFQTPYFIYANFELEDDEMELPMQSPNCLMNTLYNKLNVQKPTLMYLLDEVCTKKPILTQFYQENDPLEKFDALEAYELVNYDMLMGQQYWQKYAKD